MSDALFERYQRALRNGHVAVARGRLRDAQRAYREAIGLAGDRPLAYAALADVEFRLGDVERSLETSDEALELDPRHEAALRGRARALEALDRTDEAAETYDRLAEALGMLGRLSDASDAVQSAMGHRSTPARRHRLQEIGRTVRLAAGDPEIERTLGRALAASHPGLDETESDISPREAARRAAAEAAERAAAAEAAAQEPAEEMVALPVARPAIATDVRDPERVALVGAAWDAEITGPEPGFDAPGPEVVEELVEPEVERAPAAEAEDVAEGPAMPEPEPEGAESAIEGPAGPGWESGPDTEAAAGEPVAAADAAGEPQADGEPVAAADATSFDGPAGVARAADPEAATESAAASEPGSLPILPEQPAPGSLVPVSNLGATAPLADAGLVAPNDGPAAAASRRPAIARPPVRSVDPEALVIAAEESAARGDVGSSVAAAMLAARIFSVRDAGNAALDVCTSALSAAPANVDLHLLIAELYVSRGWNQLAGDTYQRLLRLTHLDDDMTAHVRVLETARSLLPGDPRFMA